MHEMSIDTNEPQELSLSTTAAPDELWRRWLYLCELVEKAGWHVTEVGQRWKETTDPVAKDGIWAEYEAEAREFRVLTSWKDVFYAAFVFSIDGADCTALDDDSALS